MASYLKKFGLKNRQGPTVQALDINTPNTRDTELKNGEAKVFAVNGSATSSDEPLADKIIAPGELTFEEGTSGGLGRHLGLFSTTLLM